MIDRMIEEMFRPYYPRRTRIEGFREPFVDIVDQGDEFLVVVELPGVKKEDIEVDLVDERTLVIRAERKEEEEAPGYRGRYAVRFYKSVTLPEPVTMEGGRATYRNGVLEIHLKKLKHSKGKRIKVE